MIREVFVTNAVDVKPLVKNLRDKGENVCWITISNTSDSAGRIIKGQGSNKDLLVMRFEDVPVNPLTPRQARKIKNFVFNHHINSSENWILVVNCIAGISRSAAIGRFCEKKLSIPVNFWTEPFPNRGVLSALGI